MQHPGKTFHATTTPVSGTLRKNSVWPAQKQIVPPEDDVHASLFCIEKGNLRFAPKPWQDGSGHHCFLSGDYFGGGVSLQVLIACPKRCVPKPAFALKSIVFNHTRI